MDSLSTSRLEITASCPLLAGEPASWPGTSGEMS